MQLLIITGLSGSGKSKAINALEDIGYYCVDNIPPSLIVKFAETCRQSENEIENVAIVVDARSRDRFSELFSCLNELKSCNFTYKILFLDADDTVLLHRFKETRRRHPLMDQEHPTFEEAVELERELLKEAKQKADYLIDTSLLSAAQLRQQLSDMFSFEKESGLLIRLISFGFKYGLPSDADLVFDLRCLPNPFYIPQLKEKTGLEPDVRDYVFQFEESRQLLNRFTSLLDFLLPLYEKEGKRQLVIAMGCTGGKHRSVVFAEELYLYLKSKNISAVVSHRDRLRS